MTIIPLHPTALDDPQPTLNPLPQLFHTPLGFAVVELQGTINLPPPAPGASETTIGSLTFPPGFGSDINRRVYLYIGANQRMTGELRKLAKPVGVLRRRMSHDGDNEQTAGQEGGKWSGEELEVADIVHWKIVFSTRPEPVGNSV